ncbi:uncharacterized protein [Haliotis asinina]|uniref:uncharacterized protein n=1 Tax=Haliotis asinina TaxID=109174 RepID=UPI003532092E
MIGILLLGSFCVAAGFEANPVASVFIPSFTPPAATNPSKKVSEVHSHLASVESRQEVNEKKIDTILKQMQSVESDTKAEQVSEMKSELESVGLRQEETETKLQDINTKLDKVVKALKLDTNNLALGKPAYGCKDFDGLSNPRHVVDGDKGGNRRAGQCFTSHASERKPWWMVDLQGQYDVHNVTLYGRTDGYTYRFHDLEVRVFKENPMKTSTTRSMTCAQRKGRLSRPEVLVCKPSTTGRYVMLHFIPPNHGYLTICEVEVHGKLIKGKSRRQPRRKKIFHI